MKRILITGASRGLGQTLASFLAAQGHSLILTARGEEGLRQLSIPYAKLVIGDIADVEHRESLRSVIAELGGVDIVINNASTLGLSPLPTLLEYPLEDLRQVFEVNTFAPIAFLQSIESSLNSGATVINISSDAAKGGYEGWGGYGASKAALDLLSLTLANEFKDRQVSVISVDPGDMRTEMHQAAFPNEDISDRPLPSEILPFWGWLFGRIAEDTMALSGQRFQAQSDVWEVAA